MKDVGAGDSNALIEKMKATILNHASSVPMLLESAWQDRRVEGQGPGHRWTKVPLDQPLDPGNRTLNPENSAYDPGNKMLNPEDKILAAPSA